MIDSKSERLMSLDQVASRIGCSTQTVRKWAASGCNGRILETVKFGRLVRTSLEAVERFQQPHIARTPLLEADHSEYRRVEAALSQRHG